SRLPIATMTAPAPNTETFIARFTTDRVAAHRITDALVDELNPETTAVSLFEDGERWTVEAAFHDDADRALISDVLARATGLDVTNDIAFSTIGTRDWVAA